MDDLRVPAFRNLDGLFPSYVPSNPYPRYQPEAVPSPWYRSNDRNRPTRQNKTPDDTSSFSMDRLPSNQGSELSPAPKPSDSNARQSNLSLEEVMTKLKPLLDGRPLADQQKICLKGVSLDVFNEIREKSQAGWENLSIEYFNNELIVQCPTFGHEILSTLFLSLDIHDAEGRSLFDFDTGRITMGGSADLDLAGGFIKSPDGSMYEASSANDDDNITKEAPTVVWEVAYSQSEKNLAQCLARYVACSLGSIRLAIGINIEHNKPVEGQPRTLKEVTCAFWEADYVETFPTFEESGLHSLGVLERLDEYAAMDDKFVVPAATKFGFVSEFGEEFLKFVVSQQALYKIYPEDPDQPREMHILNRHVYRQPSDDEDGEQPAFTIPFSSIYGVITTHEARHSGLQRRREILKRPLDKENPDDKNDKERITADIARLKRTRLDNA